MIRILLIEDDAELATSIAEFLELQGAECDFAFNGQSGVELAKSEPYEIILLDVMLPKMDGYNVCTTLRQQGITTPVLMLTAMGTDDDQMQGFRAGVDDYVVKPCPMPLLWVRIEALHRRSQNQHALKSLGPLKIDLAAKQLERENQSISLTPTGWKILELLLRQSPNVVSRTDIERFVWPDEEPDQGRLNVHLHALRKSIDHPFDTPLIKTMTGIGVCIGQDLQGEG